MTDAENPVVITRRDLYDRLWQTPATKLAKSFGISDVALGKICKKHDIPKPPMGYWAKLQHGKKVPRPPLPANTEASLEEITINPTPASEVPSPLSPEIRVRVDAEKVPESRIVVADRLESPHPLIEKTTRSLNSASADPKGLVSPKAKQCLNVTVGKDSIDRAMRIMDALVKAIEGRGLKLWVEDSEYGSTTYMVVMEEKFDLSMRTFIREWLVQMVAGNSTELRVFPYHLYETRDARFDSIPSDEFTENRVRLTGMVSKIRGSTEGYLQIEPMGFDVFFRPRVKDHEFYLSDVGKTRVSFLVAFTYEKAIAMDVTRVDAAKEGP